MGVSVDVIDNAPTNFNQLEGPRINEGGARVLRDHTRNRFGLTIPAFDREVRRDIPSRNIVSSKEPFLRWDWSARLAE